MVSSGGVFAHVWCEVAVEIAGVLIAYELYGMFTCEGVNPVTIQQVDR